MQNEIEDEGAKTIAEALQTNRVLTNLALWGIQKHEQSLDIKTKSNSK